MNPSAGNLGFNKLANTLQSRMTASAERPSPFDFGVIQDDYSLTTNTFAIPIPRSDYLVCRGLTLGAAGELLVRTEEDGTHGHGPSGGHEQAQGSGEHSHPASEGAHGHRVPVPENLRGLAPGDRVLVAWVGSDAVVVDIIVGRNG